MSNLYTLLQYTESLIPHIPLYSYRCNDGGLMGLTLHWVGIMQDSPIWLQDRMSFNDISPENHSRLFPCTVPHTLEDIRSRDSEDVSGLPRSMPNADQCRSKSWHWSQCRSIPINADQFRSILLIGIERHFGSMPWFWSASGIDRGRLDICIHDVKWA